MSTKWTGYETRAVLFNVVAFSLCTPLNIPQRTLDLPQHCHSKQNCVSGCSWLSTAWSCTWFWRKTSWLGDCLITYFHHGKCKVVCAPRKLGLWLKHLKQIWLQQHKTIGSQAFPRFQKYSLVPVLAMLTAAAWWPRSSQSTKCFMYDLNTSVSNVTDCKMEIIRVKSSFPSLPFIICVISAIYTTNPSTSILFSLCIPVRWQPCWALYTQQ